VSVRFVIIGAGPAGNTAATHAARQGAHVTMIERDIVGGAAHLWDCIPSKTMIATGGAMSFAQRLGGMGLETVTAEVDPAGLKDRVDGIVDQLNRSISGLLESQRVRLLQGSARFLGPHEVEVTTVDGTEVLPADAVLISTGSRPRIPAFCQPDGDRVLTTRDCYPPKVIPRHAVIIGSGVTGVEFVHMFASLGSKVTLIVSRQQVLPSKDPEVAAALEVNFLERGVSLLKGARAIAIDRTEDEVTVTCDDGRVVKASHAVLAIGSVPNSAELDLGLTDASLIAVADRYETLDVATLDHRHFRAVRSLDSGQPFRLLPADA